MQAACRAFVCSLSGALCPELRAPELPSAARSCGPAPRSGRRCVLLVRSTGPARGLAGGESDTSEPSRPIRAAPHSAGPHRREPEHRPASELRAPRLRSPSLRSPELRPRAASIDEFIHTGARAGAPFPGAPCAKRLHAARPGLWLLGHRWYLLAALAWITLRAIRSSPWPLLRTSRRPGIP